MLDLIELKRLHDKAYDYNTITRERASDDLVFYWVTQWDDNLLSDASIQYRGEFNIIRKAGRQIISDLNSNPVQVDFKPKSGTRDEDADLLDGLYLSDDRANTTIESYDTASGESVVCGYGAWELYTEYETNQLGNENQVIRRRPVHEANNNCFWDPNAKLLDKSDAKYCSVLTPYSPDGYRGLVEELTGEDIGEEVGTSFSEPEESYVFPWIQGQNDIIWVTSFYHKEQVKDKVYKMLDPLGQPIYLRQSDLVDHMDDLIDHGYTIDQEREILRWQVTKYIASGAEILSTSIIAGENIPVVPVYGERAFVEGEEHYEGITRLAKDPQRLRNFQLSYLADITSRSPRPKPIFFPEQIQGFENMYEENGADSNFPYNLQNRQTAAGEDLPIGPVAQMPEQPIPNSLAASIELSRQAVEDVANPGLPQDIADPDLSGKAVIALQNRVDQQSMVYQKNLKHAKRRDAEIYASMAREVFDAPRAVMLTSEDGTRKMAQIMEVIQDKESGEMLVLNDLTSSEFDVYADIGPSYTSKREQTIDRLQQMAASLGETDPAMQKMIHLKILTLEDGVGTKDIREYARKQLVLGGFSEPENEEEMMLLEQAAQGSQEPDAATLLAIAENKKGDAAIMREQRQAAIDQAKAINDRIDTEIDLYRAQTDRASVEVDAQKAGADIRYTNIKAQGEQIENVTKVTDSFRGRLTG